MANSSDIIKIGFDYRSSLAQFEKETNGVFDGITAKAGKQKIVIQLDAKNDKVIEKIKELQKLKLDKFTFEFGDSGIKEQLKTFGQLENKINEIINLSKGIDGKVVGNGIGNSIVDEKSLNNIIDLFTKMESHLSSIKTVFSDVGDGEEFSPLLKMINNVQTSISELSTSVKGIGLNMNIDVGSDSEMEAKVQSKIANALQAYQRLFERIKMSGAGGSVINTNFFEFDINQYDTMMSKIQAYKKFIDNMRTEAKAQFNGKDILYQSVDKSYWTQASAAMGQVTKAFNEMNAASDTNPLKDLFGSGDLSEVVYQLGLIVAKLEEISTTASSFKEVFANGFNVTASVEEIDKLTNRVKELEEELSKIKLNPVSVDKSNISSENSIRSILPSDSEFKNVISNLDLTKSKLGEIVKITRQAHADKDGKFYESFTLTDRNGSTETYGESSKTSKGQLLNYKYVEQNAKAAEQEAKALNQAWEEANKVNNALNETKNTLSSLPRMTELDTQFTSLDAKLSNLNSELTSGKISVADYKKEVKSLTSEYSKLVTIQQNRDVETYKQNAKAAEQEAKAVKRLNDELEGYNNQIPKKPIDGQRSDYFEGFVQNYKNAIAEAQKYLDTLGDSPVTKEVQDEWERLIDVIKKAKEEMDAVPNAARGSDALSRGKEIDTITKYLNKFTGISKQAKQELKGLLDQLQSGDPSVNVKKIHERFLELTASERAAGREAKSFLDIFNNKVLHRFASQLAMYYLSFYDFIRYARNAINAVKELDTALIDLKKTTTMSSSELEQFYYDSNDVAKQLDVTTAEIINQASAWSRLGFSTKEASTQMAELSAQFASISPDMDLDTATDGLVSSMKAFDIEVSNVERDIMDNINRIGNTAATSNGEIVDMLTRSSAAMAAANNTIQETIALETAAVEITRNAESTGTAFKTLSMRIRGRQSLPPYTVMYMLCA